MKRIALVTMAASVAMMTAACGGGHSAGGKTGTASPTHPASTSPSTSPSTKPWQVTANPQLHSQLPASVQHAGVIQAATDPETPPYEFYGPDNKTMVGADIDLGDAMAAKLGVRMQWNRVAFPGIIPALKSGRYQIAMSSMGDTPAREAQLDFVDYSTDGNAIVVPAGNPEHIKTIKDLCGKTVSVLQGSVMQGLVEQEASKCPSSRKLNVKIFQDANESLLQVKTRRADASMYQYGVAQYIIHSTQAGNGLQTLTFQEYGEGYNAIGIPKTDTALRDAIAAALKQLQGDGTYSKILSHWHLSAGALTKITVNDGARFAQPG